MTGDDPDRAGNPTFCVCRVIVLYGHVYPRVWYMISSRCIRQQRSILCSIDTVATAAALGIPGTRCFRMLADLDAHTSSAQQLSSVPRDARSRESRLAAGIVLCSRDWKLVAVLLRYLLASRWTNYNGRVADLDNFAFKKVIKPKKERPTEAAPLSLSETTREDLAHRCLSRFTPPSVVLESSGCGLIDICIHEVLHT